MKLDVRSCALRRKTNLATHFRLARRARCRLSETFSISQPTVNRLSLRTEISSSTPGHMTRQSNWRLPTTNGWQIRSSFTLLSHPVKACSGSRRDHSRTGLPDEEDSTMAFEWKSSAC